MKFSFNNITEFASVVVAVVYYPRIRYSFYKWFLPFLVFIFLGEMIAAYNSGTNNILVYYIISIGESVFYGYLFYRLSQNRPLKSFIKFFSIFSSLVYVYGVIRYPSDSNYYIPWLIISGFFLALVSLLYLYEKFNSDEGDLTKQPGLWVALGVSIFFSGSSIVFSLHDMIAHENLKLFGYWLYWIIPQILSVFLYGCIAVSIMLNKKRTGSVKTG